MTSMQTREKSKMKLYAPILATLLFAICGFGQVKKPVPKPVQSPTPQPIVEAKPVQKVVVEKINGDKITGLFAGGNIDSIMVDLDGSKITIKLADIALLRFADSPSQPSVSESAPKQNTLLSIEAALVYNYGGAQPVARTTFYLLGKSAEEILSDAGLNTGRSRTTFVDAYAMATIYSLIPDQAKIASQGTSVIAPHILKQTTTDFTGKATFEDLKAGNYWIFGIVKTRGGYAVWNLQQTIKEGENKVILDQNNAKTAL